MKKKLRIVFTVACMCLSIAMLSFGVFASTSATFSISSSVSYVVTNLHIDINASVAGGTLTQQTNYLFNSLSGSGGNPNDSPQEWKSTTTSGNGVTVTNPANLNALSFGTATNAQKTITFTFVFTNRGANPVKANITTNYYNAQCSQVVRNVTASADINLTSNPDFTIASGASRTITVAYTLTHIGFVFNGEGFNIQFDFEEYTA